MHCSCRTFEHTHVHTHNCTILRRIIPDFLKMLKLNRSRLLNVLSIAVLPFTFVHVSVLCALTCIQYEQRLPCGWARQCESEISQINRRRSVFFYLLCHVLIWLRVHSCTPISIYEFIHVNMISFVHFALCLLAQTAPPNVPNRKSNSSRFHWRARPSLRFECIGYPRMRE